MQKSTLKNRILLLALLAVFTMLSLQGCKAVGETAIALEQRARCGCAEHIHTQDCYLDNILVCGAKAHTHDRNCYLLKLEDNDINELLGRVDETENKSLESLIGGVLGGALDGSRSPQGWESVDDGNALTNDDIMMLNRAISDGVVQSNLILNEELSTVYTSGDDLSGREALSLLAGVGMIAEGTTEGVSTYALPTSPNTGTRAINFYAKIDNRIVLIQTGTLTNSNPDYYTYDQTAAVYDTDEIVSDLTTGNIGSAYYFKYQNSAIAATASNTTVNSMGNAEYENSRVRFGNNNTARHAILTTRSGNWWNYTYTPVQFYTVTLDYSEVGGDTVIKYVESGQDLSLDPAYMWETLSGDGVTALTVSGVTTLYAVPRGNTVSFESNGGSTVASQTVKDGALAVIPATPSRRGYIFGGWYTDSSLTSEYDFDTTVENSFTLYAGWIPRTDCVFTYEFADAQGNVTETRTVGGLTTGSTEKLPNLELGYVWVSDSRSFAGGTSVTVDGDRTFRASARTIALSYDLNFPTSSTINVSTRPNIVDYSGAFHIGGGGGTTVLSPSSTLVVGTRTIENSTRNCTAYFAGWTVSYEGGTALIRPGTRLGWEELDAYAGEDGEIEFVGTWKTDTDEIVRFFVRLDSTAANYSGSNIDTSSSKYTGEIFTTYIGGDPDASEKIEDDTADNSYTADQEIRGLLGERSDGYWLYSIPTDQAIFDALRQYTSSSLQEAYRLRFVDTRGNTVEYVDEDELNSDHYAIRWYVFKHESDGWHIDGRLVKKEGVIHIEKTFAGDEELIAAGRNDFYITASHDDSSSANEDRRVLMKLSTGDVVSAGAVTEILTPYSVSSDGLTYIWHIKNVEADEEWTIEEHRGTPNGASVYTEYSVYDSKGFQSAISRYGTEVNVTGVTYAPDEDNDYILRAEFRNLYLGSDSIAIKKEDGKSGQPISGAVFELYQELSADNWVQLMFSYDGDGNLVFDQDSGTIGQISTGDTGYSEILIKDFSYEAGPVKVLEVAAPGGYVPAPEIVLRHTGGGSATDAEIASIGGEAYEQPTEGEHMYAEYYSDEKVLVVKNYSQTTTTITAKKVWNVPEAIRPEAVRVALYANGVLASSLVPSINPTVELTEDNNYSHIWSEMPTYINGQPVTWSLKETRVGDEELTVNGSFVNWIDSYNRYETRNSQGELTELTLEVVNDIRRTMLKVEKTDSTGMTALEGASFRLRQVSLRGDSFTELVGGYDSDATSDANGWVLFDNLTAGYYMLTEASPPPGYEGLEISVYLYIDAGGKIKQAEIQDGAIVTLPDGEFEYGLSRPGDFVIRVPNRILTPLPETGGGGTLPYTFVGGLLVAVALLMLWGRSRRKEDDAPYV